MISLNAPITSLKMVKTFYALRLKKLGIETIGDLLYHIPFRYEDFSLVSKISFLQRGEKTTVLGTIASIKNIYTKRGRRLQIAKLTDETGEIEIVWYNQPFLLNTLYPGTKVTIAGEVGQFGHKLVFESPDYEIVKPETNLIHSARLVPVYPETEGISSKWLRVRINTILTKLNPEIPEILSRDIIEQFNLTSEKEAFYQVHFPKNSFFAKNARKRLSFDELLILQLAAQIRKSQWKKNGVKKTMEIAKFKKQIEKFFKGLPFELTSSQKMAISEIMKDLAKKTPMNRLLEGDVGSGKTVVAAFSIFLAHLNGFQSAFMAPTEILAKQHFQTINLLLSPFGIRTKLIVKGVKKSTNEYDVYVGTHALISGKLNVDNFGLIIIDEQQKFGVEQRAKLRGQGGNPHVLAMTATPIPRTIALTIFADLDLSVLDQMPKGRKKVTTWVVPPQKRLPAYEWIKKQINSNSKQQVFIICPFIEQSETFQSVKAAKDEFERLKTGVFPEFKIGLLHGRMKREKDKILTDFRNGLYNILVATPIIEVGIDIPAATIILIEGAERFGLSQLHQLRGRVGRGTLSSYCLLFTDSNSQETISRLKYLETINNGPKLAELDYKIRGAGEIYGTKQHGSLSLKIADIGDLELIEETKSAARKILETDSKLTTFPLLREKLQKYTISNIAPD